MTLKRHIVQKRLLNVVFVMFDLFLSIFIKIYSLKMEGKIKKLFKY